MGDFETEFKKETIEEIHDNLNSYQDIIRELERGNNFKEVFNELFRLIHNIKGNAKSANFDALSEVVHLLENKLTQFKENKIVYCENFLNLLNSSLSAFLDAVDKLKSNLNASLDFNEIKNELLNFENKKTDKTNLSFLVIDDEIEITEIIESYLKEDFKCSVTKAFDSTNALALCGRQHFDLIITDYRMPKLDGQTLIQSLRYGSSTNKDTSIIFASAFKPNLKPEAEVWKNVFILDKPFTKKNLEFLVKCALKLKTK